MIGSNAVTSSAPTSAATPHVGDELWLAQLQAADDHDLDHVAVVSSEAAAIALIAAWCRADYRDHPEVHRRDPKITTAASDNAVISAWTEILGGVRYQVQRIDSSRSTTAPPVVGGDTELALRVVPIETVREEALDDPYLTAAEITAIVQASDVQIADALAGAWRQVEDRFFAIHDELQDAAKRAVIASRGHDAEPDPEGQGS